MSAIHLEGLKENIVTARYSGTGKPMADVEIEILCDGVLVGRASPLFPDAGGGDLGAPHGILRFALAPVTTSVERTIAMREMGMSAYVRGIFIQTPRCLASGISDLDIMPLHVAPLMSIDGFQFSGGSLEISGLALAAHGDLRNLTIECEPGVAAHVRYGMANPGAGEVLWYWPNADHSMFHISIQLAATRHKGDFFKLRFRAADRADDEFERIRTTFLIPKHMDFFLNYPDANNLSRVQHFATISSVGINGTSDANRIYRLAALYRPLGAETAILDWGAGHGRVLRHFPALGYQGKLHGIDIDAENVAWATQHLPHAEFRHGPLMPPTGYADNSFDLVYGISVMTHLTRSVQEAWLGEIRRILKPGGLALLTFAGDTSVAFSSRFVTAAWLAAYKDGQPDDLPSGDLIGKIEDPGYYRNVHVCAKDAAALCARYMKVLACHECMFGYQDVLVLEK